ncbi:MAG: VWA domain-containing protein [Pseudomonadota bacterium]
MSFGFGFPWAFFLFPLPRVVWRFVPAREDRVAALRVPFFRSLTEAAGVEAREGASVLARLQFQMICAVLIWALLVLALTRPERLGEPIVIETAARDVVLGLDISGSMDARDFVAEDGTRKQRLEAVKDVLRSFIAERDGDRMALIVFGTRAFVQAPFTEDLQSLNGFLDQTAVGMAGPDTALGDAIGLAVRTFEASEVDERLMILLSDGADTSSRMTPVNAAAVAADRGVRIETIGVGDPQASGADRVDLAALEAIAKATGGGFHYASDEAALEAVYGEIDRLNPRVTNTISYRPRESLVHIPLILALLVLIGSVAVLHLGSREARV